MILLDTNVVSEAMRPDPDPGIIEWLNETDTSSLFTSTVTVAEIEYGLKLLLPGKRRENLTGKFERFIDHGFVGRVLAFDVQAAREYGEIMAKRRSMGRPMASLDGQIAAIASCHDTVLATRNVDDFAGCGIELLNPFSSPDS